MKTLHLTLKKKWFDMIASGEKKEEYREIKTYWIRRLVQIDNPEEEKGENKSIPENMLYDFVENKYDFNEILKSYYSYFKKFEAITFQNGYSKQAPKITLKFEGIIVGNAVPKWSDNWLGKVFIIKLGEIVT